MAVLFVSGCIFDVRESPGANALKPGAYHSDYGAAGRDQNHESEMVLEAGGGFHFFEIQDTTAWGITKGNWESHDGELILKSGLRRFAHYSYLFDSWDTVPADTSYLRQISDDAFERLEVSRDSGLYYPVVRWVQYHRFEPLPIADGQYAYTENYPDYYDSTKIHSDTAYMNLTHSGSYEDGRFEDGKLLWVFQSEHWSQLGSFLVVTAAHGNNYDTLGVGTEFSLDSNAEYVARVRVLGRDSLEQWVPSDQAFTFVDHWVTWRRKSP